MRRRTSQFGLFLLAVLLSATALSILTFRFLRQDEELAREREPGQRLEAVKQAQRELSADLEKIRLEEINRRVTALTSPEAAEGVNAPLVLAVPLKGDQFVLPWEQEELSSFSTPVFALNRDRGEALEFRSKDFAGAATAYTAALAAARKPKEGCEARLSLGRGLIKAKRTQEAREQYREMLSTCGKALSTDEFGMPFALYAAERLIALKLDVPGAEEFLLRRIQLSNLRPLQQSYMIRSLLQSIGTNSASGAVVEVEQQIRDFNQVAALSNDLKRVLPPARKAWTLYGDEPWLLKVTEAPSLPPLLLAISIRKLAPQGAILTPVKTSQSYPLDEFPGLHIELDPHRSFLVARAPAALIAAAIAAIVGLTILSGYLLLRGVNRDLQMAEMRSHFVASVSHELKTPLTAIRMFAETLALGRTSSENTSSEYLETIVNESERLTRLVDNVLDFSKIEQGKKIYRMRPTAPSEVVRSAARAMQYPLSQKGFDLNVSIDETAPSIKADADALEQAILNLLSNAMKYSGDSQRIDLCCGHADGLVTISVTDHGIGIASADHDRVFEKFYRVRSSDTELIAGTGLGLTLVKHIAQSHGGSVEVRSAPGKGSTFYIRIPVPSEASA